MFKYVKQPVEIEAVRVTKEWFDFGPPNPLHIASPNVVTDPKLRQVEITTLEGIMIAREGDWIIRGVEGEFYVCRDDIFRKIHKPANEAALKHWRGPGAD